MDGGSIPPSSTMWAIRTAPPTRHRRRRNNATVVLCACVIALTSCGDSTTSPTTCPTDGILPTLNRYVDGSVFIDTPWEPAPNTDLAAAIDAGGVACSYGIQEAEVGATILWAPGDTAFPERKLQWQIDGHRQVNVAGADEAWAFEETAGEEQHLWALNLLVDGVWISINATFLRDLSQALPLVDAAIAELRR